MIIRNAINLTVFGVIALCAFFLPRDVSALTLTPVRLEIKGDPGEVVSTEMTLINEEETPKAYYSSFANFEAQGETGSPSFVDPRDGLGTWLEAQESIYLGPGVSKTVPITIRIPASAEPGGHFAALFWGTSPAGQSGGGQVSIGAKTGILILLTVNGEVDEKGGILEFATIEGKKFYTSLPVPFYYRFQNSGGDRIKPEGDIKIRHMLGWVSARVPANQVEGNILPNSTRRFETVWKSGRGSSEIFEGKMGFFEAVGYQWKNFGFGWYHAKLDLTYGKDELNTKSSYGFFVLPWQFLIVFIIGATLILYIIRKILRRYNSWVISKAEARINLRSKNKGDEL